jgi:P-type Ca2+ transporter type 2C
VQPRLATLVTMAFRNSHDTDGVASDVDIKEHVHSRNGYHFSLTDADPLQPDPGLEDDFTVDDNKFAFTPGQLGKLLNPKSIAAFVALGGLAGIEKGLRTDSTCGLSVDEDFLDGCVTFEDATRRGSTSQRLQGRAERRVSISSPGGADYHLRYSSSTFTDRRRIFGDGRLPQRRPTSILRLMWKRFDCFITPLYLAALVSLVLGVIARIREPPSGSLALQQSAVIIPLGLLYVFLGALLEWKGEKTQIQLSSMVGSH